MEPNYLRYYEFGEFKLDSRRRILLKNNEEVAISAKNFDLLFFLIRHEGRILSHDELLDAVWEGTFVEQSNLKKGISALRQILGETPHTSTYIKTIPRKGYSFVAPVRGFAGETENAVELIPESAPSAKASGRTEANEKITVGNESVAAAAPENSKPAQTAETTVGQKHKTKIVAAAGILFIALAGFAASRFLRAEPAAVSFKLENIKMQKFTSSGNIHEAALSPDGKTVVYATTGEGNKQALWTKRVGQPTALQIVAPEDVEYQAIVVAPDNNSIYYSISVKNSPDILYKIPVSGGTPRRLAENIASHASFSPDGKRIALLRDKPGVGRVLFTVNAEDGSDETEIYTVADNHTLIRPSWSPNGKNFAFISSQIAAGGRIWTIAEIPADGSGTPPRNLIAPQRGKIYDFQWNKSGSELIICADPSDSLQTQIWLVSLADGKLQRLTNDTTTYQTMNLSADGTSLLAVQREKTGDLWTINWTLLPNPSRLTDNQSTTGSFAVFPDGRILSEFIENGQRGLWVFDAEGKNPQPFLTQNGAEKNPSVAPDGKSVFFTSRRSGTEELWRADADGRNLRKLTEEKTFLGSPQLSPDGQLLYFGRYDGARWRLVKMPSEGGEITNLLEETLGVFSFSPDGKSLAYSYFDGEKKRWQAAIRTVADNALQKQFDISPNSFLNWTPDGKNLIYNVSEIAKSGGSLMIQPLDGSPPKAFFDAKEDRIFWGEWSPDKQKLYFTRGRTVSNIVLLKQENQN